MPRKKIIDGDKITYKKIDESVVEQKDCLHVKLKLNKPLRPKDTYTLCKYCKFQISDAGDEIAFTTRNSWKGFIMGLMSIGYIRYRRDFAKAIFNSDQYINTQVSSKYEDLVCQWDHVKYTVETDDRIEQIAAPPSWKPCYITTKPGYTPTMIKRSLCNLAKLLDLNDAESAIETQYACTVPHEYKNIPARKHQKLKILSDYINCVEGIVVIPNELMNELCGNRILMVANSLFEITNFEQIIESDDDPGHPVPLWGYIVTEGTVNYCLREMFPYLQHDFDDYMHNFSNHSYVIFDKEYRGRWG